VALFSPKPILKDSSADSSPAKSCGKRVQVLYDLLHEGSVAAGLDISQDSAPELYPPAEISPVPSHQLALIQAQDYMSPVQQATRNTGFRFYAAKPYCRHPSIYPFSQRLNQWKNQLLQDGTI
jgi:hypothetical protein